MALRLAHLYLPDDGGELLVELKERFNIIDHYQVKSAVRNEIKLLLDGEMVESVLDYIENRYGVRDGFRIMVVPVEAVIPRLNENDHRPPDENDQENKSEAGRIYREELYEDILSVASSNRTFLLMVILSACVAAIGLLKGNVAIIIGAMVIAPLLGPNMGMAFAATLGDAGLAKKSLNTNMIGIGVALSIAFAIGWFADVDTGSAEIASRLQVSYADFVVALSAGAAGALSFTSGVPGSLIGVMVAVALLPPLMVFGLLLGNGQPQISLNALLLFATNVVCLNISGVAVFLIQGVRPNRWWEAEKAKKQMRIAISVWTALLVALSILIHLEFG